MPRKYIRKTQPKYSNEDLIKALNAIEHDEILPIDAAKHFGIPTSTIYNRLSGRFPDIGRGVRTILSKEEETFLVHVIHTFQEWQQPMTPSSVKAIAKNYMVELGRKVSIDATLKEWFYGFMNRWNNELKLAKDVKLEKKTFRSLYNTSYL
ncbi:unnamed protein product [Rotaria magnacalcarata]|nr:unnamed protein product [Rotaria magnacalcarata]CAF4328652.1 unnamed protein product [Rotaria magnacalcarata]